MGHVTYCLCTWTPPPEKGRNSTVPCPRAGVAVRTEVLIQSGQAGNEEQWLFSMRPQSTILKTIFSLRLAPSLLPSSPFFLSYIVYLFPFFCYSYMKTFLLCISSEKRHGALFVYLFVCLEWDSFTLQPWQAWYSQSSCLSLLNILLKGSPPSTWDKVSHLAWGSLTWWGWLLNELQGSPCFYTLHLSAGTTDLHRTPQILHEFWEFSYLNGKHSDHWSISLGWFWIEQNRK